MVAEEASLPNGNANADTMQLDKDTNAMAVDENDEGPAPRLLIKKMASVQVLVDLHLWIQFNSIQFHLVVSASTIHCPIF